MLKNRILILSILSLLVLPVCAEENVTNNPNTKIAPIEQRVLDATTNVDTIESDTVSEEPAVVKQPEQIPYKQPTSKRKVAMRFIKAMLGVVISSVMICILLTMYNKIRDKFTRRPHILSKEPSLYSPDNMNDAIRSFIDKTKWD